MEEGARRAQHKQVQGMVWARREVRLVGAGVFMAIYSFNNESLQLTQRHCPRQPERAQRTSDYAVRLIQLELTALAHRTRHLFSQLCLRVGVLYQLLVLVQDPLF